ncbi:single-stranded DNA-binding protein [Candidatus Pacearchaeota archaeon]|nr:single-stranded DNA-binding protein [Candidatus Pacearchaeota archaeon]
MSSYNKIILMGRLAKNPECLYLANGTAVVNFAVATNETYKTEDGEKKETVCFVDCYMYGSRAEALSRHFLKGDPIHLDGKLVLDRWEKDGQKFSKHEVKVDSWQFVQSKQKGADANGSNS